MSSVSKDKKYKRITSRVKKNQGWMLFLLLESKEDLLSENTRRSSWLEPKGTGILQEGKTKCTVLLDITRWLPFAPKQRYESLYSSPSGD